MGRPLRPALPLALLLLAAAAPLCAQTPVEPYDFSGRYSTLVLGTQLTGEWDEGRDLMLSWGRLHAGGRKGSWMRRLELGAGVTTGINFIERVLAGPQVSLARAFPASYMSFDRETRAEPYVVVGAGAFGIFDFSTRDEELLLAPAVSAGAGFRLFTDEYDLDLGTLEVVVENRFAEDESPQLHLRFGRAVHRPRRPAESTAPAAFAHPVPRAARRPPSLSAASGSATGPRPWSPCACTPAAEPLP